MFYPLILVTLMNQQVNPTIDFVTSDSDKNIVLLIINDTCKVSIKRSELHDYDKAVEKAIKQCGL